MAKLAFLGLGVMGYPMAGHLQASGHEVTVYNRTAAKAEAWVKQHGGAMAATPREAAEGADFVMACVGNDDDLRSVCLGDDGALAGMTAGSIFVDHTTVSAKVTRELFAAAEHVVRLDPGRWRAETDGGEKLGDLFGGKVTEAVDDGAVRRPVAWRVEVVAEGVTGDGAFA